MKRSFQTITNSLIHDTKHWNNEIHSFSFFACHSGLHTDLSYPRNVKSNCKGHIMVGHTQVYKFVPLSSMFRHDGLFQDLEDFRVYSRVEYPTCSSDFLNVHLHVHVRIPTVHSKTFNIHVGSTNTIIQSRWGQSCKNRNNFPPHCTAWDPATQQDVWLHNKTTFVHLWRRYKIFNFKSTKMQHLGSLGPSSDS